MDEIKARVAGYKWALEQEAAIDDDQVMAAYLQAFPRGKIPNAGFKAFEQGVLDTFWQSTIRLTIPDAAAMAGTSARYVNQEIADGRLQAEGEGKNRRVRYTEFQRWLDNPARGSRSK